MIDNSGLKSGEMGSSIEQLAAYAASDANSLYVILDGPCAPIPVVKLHNPIPLYPLYARENMSEITALCLHLLLSAPYQKRCENY